MEISQEKLEWLKSIRAMDIKQFDYIVMSTRHLYSLEDIANHSLEELKRDYERLYGRGEMLKNPNRMEEEFKGIEESNKRIAHIVGPIFISMVTAIITVILLQ